MSVLRPKTLKLLVFVPFWDNFSQGCGMQMEPRRLPVEELPFLVPTLPFAPLRSIMTKPDGHFNNLFQTKRVAAVWLQVTPRVKALTFSVYACTGASSDSRVHADNETLFSDLLVLIAQFGDIPVIMQETFKPPLLPMSR